MKTAMSLFECSITSAYMIVVWYLGVKMFVRSNDFGPAEKAFVKTLGGAFLLLAFGDSFHVGFRIFAYLFGGLEANAALLGFGKMASAITMTFFYLVLIIAWMIKYNYKDYERLTYFLFFCTIARLILVAMPDNNWMSYVAPYDWAIYRNIPFILLGAGVVTLFLASGKRSNDRTFKKVGITAIVSFGCYIPVVLLAPKIPIFGILMLPKTVAYAFMAYFVYDGIFRKSMESIKA